MNPNQALWEKGDFTRIAATMRESGEALVHSIGVTRGLDVLDLGCGDGTTALPSARLGANVVGIDIARNLVAAGDARARAEGLANCTFRHGDACDLHDVPDRSFDLVVSIFGAMFAPRPFDVANEMVRVTRPGGRIVMGNWIPGDPTLISRILEICAAYQPPPPEGAFRPITWGVEDRVVERFASAGVAKERIAFARDTFTYRSPKPPSAFLADFRSYFGPMMSAFEAAEAGGRAAELERELDALFHRENKSGRSDATSLPATFLRVTVAR